jgi:hypothetical protein
VVVRAVLRHVASQLRNLQRVGRTQQQIWPVSYEEQLHCHNV